MTPQQQRLAEELLFEKIDEIKAGYIPQTLLDQGITHIDVNDHYNGRGTLQFYQTGQPPFSVSYQAAV